MIIQFSSLVSALLLNFIIPKANCR
jgi:hypothetical protein